MKQYKGKVAIITGGASGIGKALAIELAQNETTVVIVDINLAKAEQVAKDINKNGGSAQAVYADVTNEESIRQIVQRTQQTNDRLDFMFNNAGIVTVGEIRDFELKHWKRDIDINLWGTIYGTLAAYEVMRKQGFGHIINMSSIGGLVPFACEAPYTAAKHAVVGLSVSLRAEAAGFGIDVSVVCPGTIQTDMLVNSLLIKINREKYLKMIPWKAMDVNKAAVKILKKVSRKKGVIVFPFISGHLIRWVYKYFPTLWDWVGKTGHEKIREIRTEG